MAPGSRALHALAPDDIESFTSRSSTPRENPGREETRAMMRAATILIFSTAALLLIAAPALAQGMGGGTSEESRISPAQFGPPDRFQQPPDDDFDQPPPRRGRDFGPGGPGDPRFGRSGGRRAGSSICITSRGTCDAGFVAPHNTPCRCFFPGFGEKRGAIQ
jgi:hypothetical protein